MADYRIIDADGHVMELDERASRVHRAAIQGSRVAQELLVLARAHDGRLFAVAPAKRRLGRRRRGTQGESLA